MNLVDLLDSDSGIDLDPRLLLFAAEVCESYFKETSDIRAKENSGLLKQAAAKVYRQRGFYDVAENISASLQKACREY